MYRASRRHCWVWVRRTIGVGVCTLMLVAAITFAAPDSSSVGWPGILLFRFSVPSASMLFLSVQVPSTTSDGMMSNYTGRARVVIGGGFERATGRIALASRNEILVAPLTP
jgi:hypothetical protein